MYRIPSTTPSTVFDLDTSIPNAVIVSWGGYYDAGVMKIPLPHTNTSNVIYQFELQTNTSYGIRLITGSGAIATYSLTLVIEYFLS